MARWRHWATELAPVYPGEGAAVGLCLLVNFLVVAGIMFGRNARDSLFLIYFGVKYLPYMYFMTAAILILCSLVYTALLDKIDRGKFLGGVSLIFVALLIASRVLVSDHPRWFFPVLYNLAQVIWYFSLMQFWTFVGDLFDTRQAKRLYPLLAVGALSGMITVGLGSKWIVHLLGTENLLLVWAGMIFLALVLAALTYRRYRAAGEKPEGDPTLLAAALKTSEWQKIKDGLREVQREPLLRSMAGYILVLWTVYAIVDFCFNQTMRQIYPNPNDLTTFFGRFIGVQGFLCLVIQLFFARAVIERLGVGKTINFHPAFLVLGAGWMSLRYGYAAVLSTKLGDASMLYTFSDSSYQLLYNPIPLDRRARVRGFIEGYIRPLSLAAAGLLVLVGNSYLKPIVLSKGRMVPTGQQLAWGALALAAVWLAISATAQKGYIRALLRNLQGESPALRQAAANALMKIQDAADLKKIGETLQGADNEQMIAAIQLLESFGTREATEGIATLLDHGDAFVRGAAVGALGRLGAAQYSDRFVALLHDTNARVRANAIEALAASKDPGLAEKVRPLLQDTSSRVRINAIVTVASVHGASSAAAWWPFISGLAEGDRESRSTVVWVLGRLPLDRSMDLLVRLLKDPELTIRRDAAKALGRVGSTRVVAGLVEALAGSGELRHEARRSMVAILRRNGQETKHDLEKTALTSERPEIRGELADVLGRLKDVQVAETLIRLLKDPEWRVRWKVLKSFERLARDAPLPDNARAALFDYAFDELRRFDESLDVSRTLVPNPSDVAEQMLAQALKEDRDNIEERVFRMLGILCGRDRMRAIFEQLRSGDSRLRADALEALDTLAPKKIGRQLLALLEPTPLQKGAAGQAAEPLVRDLARHPKAWLRASTALYLGYHPAGDARDLLMGLCDDPASVVRATALYAGWHAFPYHWRERVNAALNSSAIELRQCAQRILAENSGGQETIAPSTKGAAKMLLTFEKVLLLKSTPVFAALEGEELASLAELALEKEFTPPEIIFSEGQPAHHLYVLARGKVEVFRTVNSTERLVAVLGEKECFGEMAILDDQHRSASIRAAEPSLVLKIDRESFRELILERPQIAFGVFKVLSGRLRQKNLATDNLPTLDATRQLA